MTDVRSLSLARCLALKLMPDIRFFDGGEGREPVLRLPRTLVDGLRELGPGGVILFRENLASVAQCRQLTGELRDLLGEGLLIGIDQEGGRVTRLPRTEVTSFSGNMALAACAGGEELARAMAAAQAEELRALGINVNFVPSLDVNSNPDNPVIHVRSFGDDPRRVAALGTAVVQGLQRSAVAASVKHFPGHGDTSQDSHSHLPRVTRSAEQARAIDLLPFAEVIRDAAPAMVMTAHIQYPSLDCNCIPGTDIAVPATLSRRILTDLLRGELAYDGVIITDALDMRAISDLLSPEAAVEACFRAGVDIALMPLLVRGPDSLARLQALVPALVGAVRAGRLDESEVRASAARVLALQDRYALARPGLLSPVTSEAHRALEARIAAASLTLLTGELSPLAPGERVHLLMPGEASAAAMAAALRELMPDLQVSTQSLERFDPARERELARQADVYLVGVSEPVSNAAAMGGAEDFAALAGSSPLEVQRTCLAGAGGRRRIVALLSSPYPAPGFYDCSEAVLATYDGSVEGLDGAPGPAYRALAAVLCGRRSAPGALPVRLAPASESPRPRG